MLTTCKLFFYPFNSQICKLGVKFEAHDFPINLFTLDRPKNRGKRDVSDLYVYDIRSETINGNRSFSLTIELNPFYSHHILNIFFTSFLILLKP